MKRRLSLILAIGILANTIAPVYAANPPPTINITVPGETKTDVSATMAATKFNVTVPTGLPVNIDETGLITVSDGAAIINNATAPVLVDNVSVTPINTWSLTDYNTDYTKVKVDDKRLAFQLNNDNVKPDGTVDLNIQHWAPIQGKETRPLIYNAKLASQSKTFQQDIANVIFTIKFHEVSSISITEPEPIKYEFTPNDTRTLQVQFDNLIASDSNVTWSTSDANVATVEAFQQRSRGITQSGVKLCKVTAKAIGNSVITCTLPDGTSKGFDITVSGKSITGLTVSGQPAKTDYIEGTNFDPTGLEITATYNNGTTGVVTGYTILGGTGLTLGTTGVVVSHSGHQVTVPISVTSRRVTGLTITGPANTECTEGMVYEPTGLTVTANYDNGTKEILKSGAYEISGTNTIKIGSNTITVSYSGASATFTITGIAKKLTSIKAKAGTTTKTTYTEGNNFDPTGVIVTATYNNGTQAEITDYTIADGTALKLGQTTVTLKKLSCEDTIAITVAPKTLNAALQIISLPTKTTGYISEQNLDPQGLVVQANYNNGTSEIISGYVLSGDKALVAGNNTITIAYKGAVATFTIQATAKAIKAFGISKQPTKTEYIEGENFELAGTELTLTYNDNTTEKILSGALATSDGQALKLSQTTVQIIYNNKYGSVNVAVPVTIKSKSFFKFDKATGTITGLLPGYPADLIIPESIDGVPVTTIGLSAFHSCSNITSITLPNSLRNIGNYAFYGCKSLTGIKFSTGVATIGECAFQYCDKLLSLELPDSITTIGTNAFSGCHALTRIKLSNGLATLGIRAFSGCISLKSLELPSNLVTIGQGAFFQCNNLSSIAFNSGLTEIGASVFSGCEKLTHIILPDSLTTIGPLAFYNCLNLKQAQLPENLNIIGDGAFKSCIRLTSINLPNKITEICYDAFSGCESITSIDIPHSLTTLGTNVFSGCDSLENIYINKTTNSISGSPWGAPINTKINWHTDPKYFTFDSIRGAITKFNTTEPGAPTVVIVPDRIKGALVTGIGNNAFRDCTSINSITLPNSIATIGENAFYNCNSITSIALPNSLTTVGKCAFQYCTSITRINLPSGVTTLSDNAFYGCTSLNGITVPDSLSTLGKCVFQDCASLASITIPNNVTTLDDNALYNCTSLSSITLPNSLITIGNAAFNYCTSLTSITIPSSLKTMGTYAFYACTNLANIYINKPENSLVGTKWGAPASTKVTWQTDSKYFNFDSTTGTITKYNTELPDAPTKVTVPVSINGVDVKTIGAWAFKGCSKITSITLPDSILTIGYGAFSECASLASIHIPNGVSTLGGEVFAHCTGLTSIVIPDSITDIGQYAFQNCRELTSIAIHNKLSTIGQYAFANCLKLPSITLPNSVNTIGTNAFQNCPALANIYINKPTNSISGSPWGAPASAKIEWRSDPKYFTFDSTAGSITKFNKGVPGAPTEIIIPRAIDGVPVRTVGEYAFKDCTNITSVTIPNTVTNIDTCAFYGCTGISTITLPDSVTSLGPNSLNSCTSLTSLALPKNLVTLGAGSFSNCPGITTIDIPNKVTTIGDSTFYQCSRLASVTIPSSVTSIGYGIFESCPSLTNVYINKTPNSLSGAPWKAPASAKISWQTDPKYFNFAPATGAITKFNKELPGAPTVVMVPDSINGIPVKYIGGWAFNECTGITSITMPDSITEISERAFNGCSNISGIKLPESLKTIGKWAFYCCNNITSFEIPKNVTEIAEGALRSSPNLSSFTSKSPEYRVEGDRYLIKNNTNELVAFAQYSLNNIIMPESITKIGGSTLYYCADLTGITLPSKLTSIGNNAFDGCMSLANITIPSTVTTIGTGAFATCNKLSTITIEKPTNSITGAPWSAPSSTKIAWQTPSRSFEATGGTITAYNPGLAGNPTSINIPSIINNTPVSVIGPGVFKGLSNITTVTLPDTLTTISDGAFYKCTSLTSISIPNSVTSVEKFAFYGCNKLETARLPQGISKISEYTFGGCTKLRQINLPNGIKVIEPNAFHSCINLPSIALPSQLTTLGAGALNNCASLTAIILPETLQTISPYAFYNCINLAQITIPRSVTTIGEHTFDQCNKISTISIQKTANSLQGAPWGAPWNTKILWGAHPRYFNFSTGIITKFNQGIAEAPKQVIIPQSINGVTVTKIGKGAFQNCPDITEIVMPDSIATIEDSGFEGCTNLDSVKLSKNLTAIGHCAFYKCEKLTNIELPSKLPKIGSSAFNSCLKISNITIPNSVTEIAFYAFANCPSLTSITLPNSITTIGVGPFEYCPNLANIYIAKPINSIQGAPWGAPSNPIVHWDQV